MKLAIRHSDGIIINGENIPSELIDYAKNLGKQILYKQTDKESNCHDFYNSLLG